MFVEHPTQQGPKPRQGRHVLAQGPHGPNQRTASPLSLLTELAMRLV
jgi:hypothetical protein